MKHLLFLGVIGISALSPSVFAAGHWAPVQGEYTVQSAPLSDPIPGSPPVAFFTIKGAAAKAMFDGMRDAKTEANACGENGLTMKFAENLVCSKQKGHYSCNFGVGLSDGKLRLAYTC